MLVHGFTTHLDFIGDSSWHSYWTRRLGERFRVIPQDKRGTGLSDRMLGHGSRENRVRDVVAVMDAAGSATASIVGISEGGPIALTFAATVYVFLDAYQEPRPRSGRVPSCGHRDRCHR